MQFPHTSFEETHWLAKDHKFMPDSVCANDIKSGTSEELLRFSMIVMPLKPGIRNWKWEQFPKWPPYKIHSYYGLKGNADLVAFGLHPKNSSWSFIDTVGRINFSTDAVDTFLIRVSSSTHLYYKYAVYFSQYTEICLYFNGSNWRSRCNYYYD